MAEASDAQFPVRVEIPVAWGEMDAFQHVNNVAYLRWFETARIKFFEHSRTMERMKEGLGPILARTEIDYRLPLTYPDVVTVEIGASRIGGSSFDLRYRLTSAAKKGAVGAEGLTVIVMYDYGKAAKTEIWPSLRAALGELSVKAPAAGG